jgi:signal transduction histidine kinase/DNA-binding response OmpR family regulator
MERARNEATTAPDLEVSPDASGDTNYTHTILIVDDNPTNLGVLSNYLKSYGFRILVARSGESALQKAIYVQPDIILLDVLMPGIDGFETCLQLKAERQTRDIPVIFMTALAEASDKVRGFQVGGIDYVIKPLQFDEVLARLNTHLRLRKLTQDITEQAELFEKMNNTLLKRTIQLETSTELAREVTSILDLDELMNRVVELIQSKFSYYFVGIWLMEEERGLMILQAGAGAKELDLPANGSSVPLHQDDYTVVWVGHQGIYHLIEDISSANKRLATQNLPAARSILTLPLRLGQESIGALEVMSEAMAAFSDDDILALQALGDQIAIAIRNAEFYKVEQRRRRLAESLEQTSRVLSGSFNTRQVPKRILKELAMVVPYEHGSIFLQREDALYSLAQRTAPGREQANASWIPLSSKKIFQRITDTRRAALINDVTREEEWPVSSDRPLYHSWLGVPLIAHNKVLGMMSLTRQEPNAFTMDDVTMALAFAGQAAIALENATLYDEITQLNEELEQKVAQRTAELKKAYKLLEQLDQAKSDFINVISHELRTPLSVIKGYSQILNLMSPLGQDEQAAELLGGINTGVNRLHQIVNAMLDVARIDNEVLRPQLEKINLHGLMVEIIDTFAAVKQERRLDLKLIDLTALPAIEADPDLLKKVFYNLVVNAIKYTPDGGQISASGRLIEPPGETPRVELLIQDSGIGINPEHHQQIFEKFYQTGPVALHSSGETKFKGGGPGLGLAVARGIVLAHGGQIWVESEKHDEKNLPGSTFHVLLPVSAASPSQGASHERSHSPQILPQTASA